MSGAPYFDKINLDFRNLATQGTGQIDFDLNPQYDTNVRTWTAAAFFDRRCGTITRKQCKCLNGGIRVIPIPSVNPLFI